MKSDGHMGGFLASTAVFAFAVNWLWEMIQMPAYAEMAGKTWGETAAPCAIASLGDLVMTLAIFGIVALAAEEPRWAIELRWHGFAAAALLGMVFATAYEWRVLAFGLWTYTADMPLVPWAKVGLWPFIQLPFLVPLALLLSAVITRKLSTRRTCP
jgi:hypothetical protein